MAKNRQNIEEVWLAKQLETIRVKAKPIKGKTVASDNLVLVSGLSTCYLTRHTAHHYREIIDRIVFGPLYRDYISESVARDLVNIAVTKAFKDKKSKPAAKSLMTCLRGDIKQWEVVVPLEGIAFVEGRSLTFGKVRIEGFNASRAQRHSNGKTGTVVVEGKSDASGKYIGWGETNAVVSFFAFEGSQNDIALQLVQETLNIFRLFLRSFKPHADTRYFGEKGSISAHYRVLTHICPETGAVGVYRAHEGHRYIVELIKDDLANFRQNKYFKMLSKMLAKEKRDLTEFEVRLIKSASWLGRSYAETDFKLRFLFAVICCEALLSLDRSGVTKNLVQCISGIYKVEPEERKAFKDTVEGIYRKRSRLVHVGSDEVDTKDIGVVRNIANTTLMYALDRWPRVISDEHWREELVGLKTF